MTMKVLHLNTRDAAGGAARGVYWLHQGLRQAGVDSQMLVARKHTQDDTVHTPLPRALSRLAHAWRRSRDQRIKRRVSCSLKGFTPGAVSIPLGRKIRQLAPDLLHLHWFGEGYIRPEDFRDWPYPIVWTLRDMWAFSGGCSYSRGCDRYQTRCGDCPILECGEEQDYSRVLIERKETAWREVPMTLVALSSWLADCARRSSLFAGQPIQVIPNAIDTTVFRPLPQQEARQRLGLPLDKQIIVFGAIDATQDQRKGYAYLVEALQRLAGEPLASHLHMVIFGNNDENMSLPAPNISASYLGFIHDDAQLASLYSAADVTVVPSTEEAFGKIAAESLACETPVVCFTNTGLVDVVAHRECGYCAEALNAEDLARGIQWILEAPHRSAELGGHGRKKVEQEFSLEQVTRRYRALYEECIARQQH